ncbi:MAG: hypothetical protein AAF756_22140 [Pseudomonadota bacterium]
MNKDMYELSVRTDDGLVVIDGREPGSDETSYSSIKIPVEQVDTLISFLKEAKAEITNSR